jgi:acetylornithine deacetylase/succinyl-diaminopimelate desuccinylase-like protein
MKCNVLSESQALYWLEELCKFGSLPNNVFDATQILNNAYYLEELLQHHGFQVQLWNTPSGKPYVFADLSINDSLPTILFYSHYDGVPVDTHFWLSDPYKPVIKNAEGKMMTSKEALHDPGSSRIYARSIADSKNATISILAALYSLRSNGEELGVNIKLLLDGEEELESPFLKDIVLSNRHKLRSDLVISASGEAHQSGLPTIAFGVRGILLLDLSLYTATADVHSGHFGNFTPNAALQMIHLLSRLKDCKGRVLVPGFYDDVKPLAAEEYNAIRQVPAIENRIMEQFGIRNSELQHSLQELINLPTFNIRGLQAGYVGELASNIIPTTAKASIDIRLVDGMDPAKTYHSILAYFKTLGIIISKKKPTVAELWENGPILQVEQMGSFRAVKTGMSEGLPRKILDIVQRSTTEPWVVEPTEGGSLNFEVFRELGLPLITLPVSNFDCNQHTHNENLRLDFFLRGISIFKELLQFKL